MYSKILPLYIACWFLVYFTNGNYCVYSKETTSVKPSCGKNEVYSKCGNNGCRNTCKDPTFAERCKGPCIPGCVCKDGFLLNDKGKCVSKNECGLVCKKDELLNRCPRYCTFDKTCGELFGYIRDCPPPPPFYKCKPTCYCKPGYVRIDGVCRPPSKCCSDPNEELVKCPNPCPGGTCDQPNFAPCRKACRPMGCQCKKGYVRDENKKCIPLSQCPGKNCSTNEVWNNCPGYCTFDMTCERLLYNILPDCPPPPPGWQCTGKCRCIPGYVRINQTCLPQNSCCDGPNQEVVSCPNQCPGGTCEQPEFSPCDAPCPSKGCQCIEGYVKNQNNICIATSDCPEFCGPNEVYNFCSTCYFDETCESLFMGIQRCPENQNGVCHGRCECANGFVRINGKCVSSSECCSEPNTQLVRCPNPCPGGTCHTPHFLPCNEECSPWGCQCDNEFVKNKQGRCVKLSECNESCGKNEVWNDCAPYCSFDMFCEMLLYDIVPDCTPPPPFWRCSGRCECDKGFVRIDGLCQPEEKCCSDPNSIMVNCPNPCPGGTCAQPHYSDCDIPCRQKGCICKKGYVKSYNGTCIPINDCEPLFQCTKNEKYNHCPNECSPEMTCDDYLYNNMHIARPSCSPNMMFSCSKPRCECETPYVRNSNGECIHRDECCSDPNEEVVSCPNPCPGGTCFTPNFLPCGQECAPWGCQCKKGYVKNKDRKCVKLSTCNETCGLNEVWKDCVPYCSFEKDCFTLFYNIMPMCVPPPPFWRCSGGCRCIDGFIRINGTCQTENSCCPDPNSKLVSCPNPCPGGTCAQPQFSGCNIACTEKGCMCKDGFVKSDNGTCIPISDCEPLLVCGENEKYNPCPNVCEPESSCNSFQDFLFEDFERPLCDPDLMTTCGEPRCECVPPYVRNPFGKCAHRNECCTQPNTEMVQCPNPCPGGTCMTPKFLPCERKCRPWGCQCKEGFVKNRDGNCIELSQCNETCGKNEVWNDCVQYCSFEMSCEMLMFHIFPDCAAPPLFWRCYGRCECKQGLLRINGTCQPENMCCEDPNAILVDCPNPCPGGTCAQPEFSTCDIPCTDKGCMCKDGFVKSGNDTCISISDCKQKNKKL